MKPLDAKTYTPQTDVNLPRSEVGTLEGQAGVFGRLVAGLETKGAAATALRDIRKAKIDMICETERTAIELTKATVKLSMVGAAMNMIGTATTQLGARTAAVDQALTNGASVERFTHFRNRKGNLDMFRGLLSESGITAEEHKFLEEEANADCYSDINRTRDRLSMAKDAVATIHAFGLTKIQTAKDKL